MSLKRLWYTIACLCLGGILGALFIIFSPQNNVYRLFFKNELPKSTMYGDSEISTTKPSTILDEWYPESVLPTDIFVSQIKKIKSTIFTPTSTKLAIVGPTYSAYETPTFIGILKLDEEKNIWQKYIQVGTGYSWSEVYDIGYEFVDPSKQIIHLFVHLNNGAGSGEGDLIELVQNAPKKNSWHVATCSYFANDLGVQIIYSKDTHGTWYLEQYNKGSGQFERIDADGCNKPPQITLYSL